MRQVVLDTETTGLSAQHGHRLTEIGCLEIIDRRVTGKYFQTYLNPDRELDDRAAEITGLSWSMLKDKPRFVEIVENFVAFIDGSELIIHNAPFDLSFLDHEISLAKHSWGSVSDKLEVIDTLVLSREMFPGQRNSLDALCKRYSIDNSHRTRHGALLDAEILASVYLAMTAGQTNLDLMTQTVIKQGASSEVNGTQQPIARAGDIKVVYADEQELADHAAMMAVIKQQKK